MRQPTSKETLYGWYWRALRGRRPPITEEPMCGWYQRRLVRKGPFVPCRIFMEQPVDRNGELTGPEMLRCEVMGDAKDPVEQWPWFANYPITEAEYHKLMERRVEAGWYETDDPLADPTKPIEINKTKVAI